MKSMLDGTRFDMLSYEWKDLLDDFASCVKANQYEKMPYATWRDIMNDLKSAPDFETFSVAAHNQREVRVYGYRGRWIFFPGDGSFGDYLFDTVLRGAKNMYMTDTSGIDYGKILNEKTISYDLAVDTKADRADVEFRFDGVTTSIRDMNNKIATLSTSIANASPMRNCVNKPDIYSDKENNMKFNFDFGPVNAATVRMSMYGLAIKNKAGTWVSYDTNSGDIMDVDVFNFDGAKFLYKMPVAIKDIRVGDVVIHNNAPMFVVDVAADGKALTVVDTFNGERKHIMLPKSPFGFNFATKVVNFLGNMMNGPATEENPFGNMWMLMAMSSDNADMNDMLPFMMMANGGLDMSNPMMLWALMSNRTNDPLMLAMMMNGMNKPTAHECKCSCNHE